MIDSTKVLGTVAYLGGLMALPEAFCWAWGELREFNALFLCDPGEMIHYTKASFSLHAHARNDLCESMLGEFLLMLDTDVIVEPDVLMKMLAIMQRYNVPVLSSIYRHKVPPYHGMLWQWSDEDDGFVPIIEYDKSQPCFRVGAVGGGCLLIHSSVLARLHDAFPNEGPFDHRGRFGEDLSFCVRCREVGIPIYATPQVECVHLMAKGVTDDQYIPGWWSAPQEVGLSVPGEVIRG